MDTGALAFAEIHNLVVFLSNTLVSFLSTLKHIFHWSEDSFRMKQSFGLLYMTVFTGMLDFSCKLTL